MQETKKYLEQLKRYSLIIKNKKLEIMELDERMKSPGTNTFWHSGSQKKTGTEYQDKICVDLDKIERLKQEIHDYYKRSEEIIRNIELLECDEYIVLYDRYVKGMSIFQIAEKEDRSDSWVSGIQSKAMKHLKIILEEQKQIALPG